ncbi:unnamed protein product, partial [Mesorhabditis spiculigera]
MAGSSNNYTNNNNSDMETKQKGMKKKVKVDATVQRDSGGYPAQKENVDAWYNVKQCGYCKLKSGSFKPHPYVYSFHMCSRCRFMTNKVNSFVNDTTTHYSYIPDPMAEEDNNMEAMPAETQQP